MKQFWINFFTSKTIWPLIGVVAVQLLNGGPLSEVQSEILTLFLALCSMGGRAVASGPLIEKKE